MAEFIHPKQPPTDGFDAMGKPIPAYRRQAGYDALRKMGLTTEAAWSATNGMAEQLERDQPYEGMNIATKYVDLTGSYMLMAFLLTAPKPMIKVTAIERPITK
jgi:hypothetical protein